MLGVEREITWEVKARKAANVLTVLATTGFDYTDFNVPAISAAGAISVEDDVVLQVQLVAQAV